MSHLVAVAHIDTCLACYVQDHHNRPGELLLGVDVYSQTRVHEVRAALIDAYRCDTREDGPAFDHVVDAIAGCFKGAHPLKAFDRTLDHNLADSEGEACQAWFLITWPVADDDAAEAASAPLASAEQQATPVQQQQARAYSPADYAECIEWADVVAEHAPLTLGGKAFDDAITEGCDKLLRRGIISPRVAGLLLSFYDVASRDYLGCTQATPVQQAQACAGRDLPGSTQLAIFEGSTGDCEHTVCLSLADFEASDEQSGFLPEDFAAVRRAVAAGSVAFIGEADYKYFYAVGPADADVPRHLTDAVLALAQARCYGPATGVTFEAWQAARYAVPRLADCPALAMHFDGMAFADGSDLGGWVYPLGSVEGAAMYVEACPYGYRFDAGGGMMTAHTVESVERLLWLSWACDCLGDRLAPDAIERMRGIEYRDVNAAPLPAL